MADSTYYVTLPNSGVTAEVTAYSTRQARTVYLDYLTRSGVVPWRGRTDLRDQIIIDRIDPGQIPTDIQLSYGQQAPMEEEELELNGNGNGFTSDYTQDPYAEEPDYQDYSEYAPSRPAYQNGAAFGPVEREVRTQWGTGSSYDYEEDVPSPTVGGPVSRAAPARKVMPSPVNGSRSMPNPRNGSRVGRPDVSSARLPSPTPTPRQLPGPVPGMPIPGTPGAGQSIKQHPLGSGTKIDRLVKDRFPKGKV